MATLGQLPDNALATTEGKPITVSPMQVGKDWFSDTMPRITANLSQGDVFVFENVISKLTG